MNEIQLLKFKAYPVFMFLSSVCVNRNEAKKKKEKEDEKWKIEWSLQKKTKYIYIVKWGYERIAKANTLRAIKTFAICNAIHNSRHQSQKEKNQAKNDGANEIFRMEMYKKNNKYFEMVDYEVWNERWEKKRRSSFSKVK